ncbi:MAG: hypothetical protein AAF547_06950, partial [Actinomycetota bacterium]
MEPMQFDALRFAPAWLNSALAASEDDEYQPVLYRSALVEWYPTGVQLVSCGTADHDYHCGIASGGSYLGFDRFGL